jgi:hypothetical protein
MWIYRLMTNRLMDGGLGVPAPLLSRTYQVLSDGTAAAMQARKVSHVEFPFALRQLLAVLLCTFIVLAPMCIGAFVNSVALTTALSFFVCLGYVALNETARELEQPFGFDANDLKLTDYQVPIATPELLLLHTHTRTPASIAHRSTSTRSSPSSSTRRSQSSATTRPRRRRRPPRRLPPRPRW